MAISLANLQGKSTFTSATPPPHARLLDEPFASLLSETRSALSSPDFAQVLSVSLDHATEILFESLEKNIFRPSSTREGEGKGEEVRLRLAALLPGLAKWSQLALNGLPNELIDVSFLFLAIIRLVFHHFAFLAGCDDSVLYRIP
jgi:peroxin-3